MSGIRTCRCRSNISPARSIILSVQRQPGANVIQVAESVKKLLPLLQASLPQGLEVKVLSDRTETVRASVEDVEFTLVLTIGLVVMVIFAFLRNLRATLIPSIAVPLSLITRLERFPADQIASSDGKLLVQYRGALMPLLRLGQKPGLKADDVQPVLVFSENAGSFASGTLLYTSSYKPTL